MQGTDRHTNEQAADKATELAETLGAPYFEATKVSVTPMTGDQAGTYYVVVQGRSLGNSKRTFTGTVRSDGSATMKTADDLDPFAAL